jgi:DHA1 family tetracycline resistance protein-like MFS transporter
MDRDNKKILFTILFTVFLDLLGFGILVPITPPLFIDPHAKFYLLKGESTMQHGYILLGLLLSAYSFTQFLFAPILGQLSDKFGRKKLLYCSLMGTAVSYIMFILGIWSKNIPLLFIARLLDGATGGNISIAQAVIADITPRHNRAKNFGLVGAALGLGLILGPYVGGKFADVRIFQGFDTSTPFLIATVLSIVNVISVMLFVPETNKHINNKIQVDLLGSTTNILQAFSLKDLKVRIQFLTNFLFQSGFAFFTTFFSVYLIHRFKFAEGDIGDFFAYIGFWVVFTQAVLTRFQRHIEEESLLRMSLIVGGLTIGLYFLATQPWQLFIISPLFAIFNGLNIANLNGLISKSVDESMQGKILGINSSVQALAQIIPAVLSGILAAQISPQSPIILSAVVIVISGILFNLLYKRMDLKSE